MNKEQLAAQLDGREYATKSPTTKKLRRKRRACVVFGYSDDKYGCAARSMTSLVCYNGGTVIWTSTDLYRATATRARDCPTSNARRPVRRPSMPSGERRLFVDITRQIFRTRPLRIVEDGEKFCRGIVFSLADVKRDRTRKLPPTPEETSGRAVGRLRI